MTNGQDTLDKGMTHVPCGMKQEGAMFHHAAQNGMQFKTYELFISVIFHLIFSVCDWPQVTETMESETTDEGTTI